MKKILFTIYTGEFPNQFSGGPNNIIYKVINSYLNNNYDFDYLSYDLFVSDLNKSKLSKVKEKRSTKKKTTSYLAENSNLYRNIFESDFYLPYHFHKRDRYYKSFQDKLSKYAIIHSHDSIALSLVANNNLRSKKIATVHSKGPLSDELKNMANIDKLKNRINAKLKKYELKSMKLADIITFPSKAARGYFENSLDVELDDTKVRIIYNGINFNEIYNISSSEKILEKYSIKKTKNRLLLLNIAAHTSEKNIDILLRVVEKIKFNYKRDILLVNVGEGNLTEELITLSEKLNIQNNVRFLGKLPNEDVIKLLKATDIFIMSSEKVIFDIVVIEALVCGTCCVVSNEGGNTEIIKDGYNGYLIDIDDVDKIAEKIISIDINKVKTNAIETAKQFSVQKMVEEYFEVYESLLDGV